MTQETEDQDKIPFRIRFKAWWEGVEPESLLEHGAISSDPNSIAVSDPDAEGEEAVHWNETRIEMAGRIWGTEEEPDVVLPGGVDYTLSLAKPMGLNAEKTVLDLCAGLGGGVLAVVRAQDVVFVHDATTGDVVQRIDPGFAARLSAVAVSPKGDCIAIGSEGGELGVWKR